MGRVCYRQFFLYTDQTLYLPIETLAIRLMCFLSILALISSSFGDEAEFDPSSNLGILSPVLNKKQFFGT